MEAVRTKDKLFLAIVVPVALAAAYVYFWRTDAVRRIAELEREEAALVTVGDFPAAKGRAERALAAAREARTAESRIPMPAAKVRAKAEDSIAARERMVLEIFRVSGLTVEKSGNADNGDAANREVLARTGLRPEPVCRRYAIAGSYPQLRAALRIFAEREMAVIPDRVEMSVPGRWSLLLWL